MQFEEVTYKDLDEIRNLQPEGWSDIVPEFESYINQSFCHPVKTRLDNKIVGLSGHYLKALKSRGLRHACL
jgi:hypothetical protein